MPIFTDARTVPAGSVIDTDLAIIGAGPAGMSLAMALANTPIRILLLESGGGEYEAATQALYKGSETGVRYLPLDACRLRFLGGSSNHWGGWCRPLDPSDFEKRAWLAHSGWPFSRKEIEPYFARAQALIEAGAPIYDGLTEKIGDQIALGKGGVYTSYFQFSKTRHDVTPTAFGERYGADLRRIPNLQLMEHANITALGLAADAKSLDHLDVATLSGNKFTVKPKYAVIAAGGVETARLMLASNDVMKTGVGNANDLVGRFFADHAIPRNTATMVLFDGKIAPYYKTTIDMAGVHMRATFSPTEQFKRERQLLGSLTTVENHVELDALGKAAVAETASALGVDSSKARAFALGCGIELAPDPERRFTLTSERDALGMPRLNLNMTVSDDDFARYRETMKELGRQLLAAKSGMIRLDQKTRAEWLSVMDWGNHHMGTARMHDDPKQGVVDANSQVHGIPNLYVAGSAVFPTYGSSNPTMNLVALTLRLADHLKGIFK
mgnify:CR=1 FL=1